MRTVTLPVEEISQARINKCDPPGLFDVQTGIFAILSNKTVHATIKVGEFEAVPVKEANNIFVVPIPTMTRPLDKDSHSTRQDKRSNFFKSFPQFPKFSPMPLDLRDSRAAPMHVDISPGSPPCTWAREPKRGFPAKQVLTTFIHGVNRTPVVMFVNRNHLASFRPSGFT